MSDTPLDGTCDRRFTAVRDAFAANFSSGLDVGASVAVVHRGHLVVDLWGGFVDEERTTPWERDTITNVFSTTKTMSSLAVHILADRGQVDLDAPIATYWPEFAANGKEGVLVRHALGHTAGLSGWEEKQAATDLYDWDGSCAKLARQAPWWEPGTASGYHAITQGYLLGEIVRRVTGSSVGTWFREEVTESLDADFHIGLDPAEFGRIAPVIPPPLPKRPDVMPPMLVRTMTNPRFGAEQSWEDAWRTAEIPAANGHGNARSVALCQAVVSTPVVEGVSLLSRNAANRILETQSDGDDLVLGDRYRFGMGWALSSPGLVLPIGDRACFWGGWGGSVVVNDLDRELTVAFVMNKMRETTVGDERSATLVAAAQAAVA